MGLEKGMIVLSTAVAGGPFIGLLGTVWGVMSTFASIAENNSASLTTMAPGVAAALVATVTGLLVAIPGDVRLQLHGDEHPRHHAGTGRLRLAEAGLTEQAICANFGMYSGRSRLKKNPKPCAGW